MSRLRLKLGLPGYILLVRSRLLSTGQGTLKCMRTPTIGGACGPPNPLLSEGASPPDPSSLISLNMRLEGHDPDSMVMLSWKCILFSDVKTQGPGSVFYFRGWESKDLKVYSIFRPENTKTWKCILYSDPKTVRTIPWVDRSENSIHFQVLEFSGYTSRSLGF